MSVTNLAAARGVSKQAISKMLARHEGQIPTRKDGARLMVDVDAFDRMTHSETDPSQALRNRNVEPSVQVTAAPQGTAPARTPASAAQQVFSASRAKREAWEAELSRIALEKEIGKLVSVNAVTDAMVECGQKIVRVIDQLPSKSEDPAVRAILKQVGQELRAALYESMKLAGDAASEEAKLLQEEDAAP